MEPFTMRAGDRAATMGDAGFTVKQVDRFRFPSARLSLPMSPHVVGLRSVRRA
jgi:hypothetical protein